MDGPSARICTLPVDRQPLLAALGVLSHESIEQTALRDSLRETMGVGKLTRATLGAAKDGPPILSRFVLRVSREMASRESVFEREAAVHGDVVLLELNCSLSGIAACPGAALLSLFGWFRCALTAWPNAWTVGKAEPDAYVYLPGVANHLSISLSAVESHALFRPWATDAGDRTKNVSGAASAAHMYWGAFELYHWMTNPSYHAARGHHNGNWWLLTECKVEPMPMGRVGPFAFAKGPLLFLSSSLAHSVVHNASVTSEADAAIRFAEQRGMNRVWEDVFLGFAVTLAARRPVFMVEDPSWYLESGPAAPQAGGTILVAHLRRNKSAAFVQRVHRYLQQHQCTTAALQHERWRISFVNPKYHYTLCGGARLVFGQVDQNVYKAVNCSGHVILHDDQSYFEVDTQRSV